MEKTFNAKREELVALINENGTEEQISYIDEVLKKAKKGSGIKKESQTQVFRALILEKGELDEFEIYMKFNRAGRHEAMTLARSLRERVPEGQEKVWVQDYLEKRLNPFTQEEEEGVVVYRVIGIGDDQPEEFVIKRKRAPKEMVEEETPAVDEDFESEIGNGIDIH